MVYLLYLTLGSEVIRSGRNMICAETTGCSSSSCTRRNHCGLQNPIARPSRNHPSEPDRLMSESGNEPYRLTRDALRTRLNRLSEREERLAFRPSSPTEPDSDTRGFSSVAATGGCTYGGLSSPLPLTGCVWMGASSPLPAEGCLLARKHVVGRSPLSPAPP